MTSEPLAQLRARTRAVHQQLEAQPLLQQLMAADCSLPILGRFLQMQQVFYAGLEPQLLPLLVQHGLTHLYRPRAALFADDLARLGYLPLAPAAIDPWPASQPGLLGVVYAIEGSALGGQVIDRHLRATLGAAAMAEVRAFRILATGIGRHWQLVLRTLDAELVAAGRLRVAVDGSRAVFSTLCRLAAELAASDMPCAHLPPIPDE